MTLYSGDNFLDRWLMAKDEKALNEILMRDDHFYHGPVEHVPFLKKQIGLPVGELELPASCLLALIERDRELLIAKPDVILMAGDDIAIIGEPEDIARLG